MKATSLAKAVIYEALRQSGVENDVGLRTTRGNGKLLMKLDKPNQNDTVIKLNQSSIIIIGSNLEAEIGDLIIDINPVEDENELVLRRLCKPLPL